MNERLSLLSTLKNAVEAFAKEKLAGVKVEEIRAKKLIRDALTETAAYEKHEIAIIDLPLIQRLRRIHQTGLAFLTYPCTGHNRFQHTLGVTNIVSKLANSLMEKYSGLVDSHAIRELRLAAILHDIGHGPFSHPTEEILIHMPEIKTELLKNPKFSKAKPHEVLSYYIITSDAFKGLIKRINTFYDLKLDIDRIANMIVGDMDKPQMDGYMSDLINGPFDADKLDYMPRDAYFSGLKMEVDLERIAYTCLIDRRGTPYPRRLCTDVSGAHNLEQIMFNKVLLYSSMYHHHKVRATACAFKSIFEIISDRKLEIDGLSFEKATDFLSIDDYDVLSKFGKVPELAQVVQNLKHRRLLKRALVMSRKTAKDPRAYQKLIRLSENPKALRELRELIVDEVVRKGGVCSVYDLWIDLPEPPSLREPSQCIIKLTEKDYVTLDTIFPADWWLTAYGETKWKGHIFCPPDTKLRQQVNKLSQIVLEETLGVGFEETATMQAKIPGLYY